MLDRRFKNRAKNAGGIFSVVTAEVEAGRMPRWKRPADSLDVSKASLYKLHDNPSQALIISTPKLSDKTELIFEGISALSMATSNLSLTGVPSVVY